MVSKRIDEVYLAAGKVGGKHPDLGLDPLPAKCPRDMPLPEGWSLRNFLRAKPKKIEEVAARIGRMAAHALARPVRTTRAEMAPGMQYVFDDLTHDNDVVVSGQLQPVRPMELACVDVASAYKAAFWLMPSRVDALTQKRQVLRERHMRFLVAHVLCNVGFHPDGVTLLVENGTAAIRRDLEEILHGLALRDDGTPLIEVSRSGVDRATAHPGQWGSAAKGNFRAKSHLESWNNLSHNRLDDLPGQTGSNARLNAPEDLPAMERVSERLLLAGMALPPELASRLQMPVLDWRLFTDVLTERYAQIHNTHDHALEGWERRTERQWRLSLTDSWHSEAAWRELSDEQQRIYAPVIAQAGNTRVARLSRFQVWRAGMDRLVRLPDYATALICGRDLAEVRPCPATMSVRFIDQETSATPMDYRLQSCVAQDGRPVTLIEGRMYRWMISPFDPSKAFVLQLDGSYVGRIERVEAADRTDMDAVHRAMGKARADFDAALAPLARRGAAIAKQQIEALRANTAVLQAGNPRAALGKPTAAERAEESAIDAALDGLAAGN
jgi:hypothetical protein